jgi:hypothetical protein
MNIKTFLKNLGLAGTTLLAVTVYGEPPAKAATMPTAPQRLFATPEAAVEALIAAAERIDTGALKEILGTDGVDLVVTNDPVLDKNQSAEFVAQARKKTQVIRDPKDPNFATLSIGTEDWPMPIPLIQQEGKWRFDSEAGRQEILNRRIGHNELDAIQMCLGYVEAQHEYASQKRGGARVNQYAQHVISTPGKQDGLAWQAPDGSWQGPVGRGIAGFIAEGYTDKNEPFHGYYFKILKGQGPAAPMGEMEFSIKGMMIAGFALVAAPSSYGVTGMKTFIVNHTGVVYEKDLGPDTLEQFRKMERYNPDPSWTPVQEP